LRIAPSLRDSWANMHCAYGGGVQLTEAAQAIFRVSGDECLQGLNFLPGGEGLSLGTPRPGAPIRLRED
jgi:hypothetical protein